MGINNNLQIIKEKIDNACKQSGRSVNDITIIGVTKHKSIQDIQASLDLGINNFGESYIQEAIPKITSININKNPIWHFIGRLQTNKIKYMKNYFSYIHSIDSIKQITELQKKITTQIKLFFELKISDEKTKGGTNIEDILKIIDATFDDNKFELKGLMCLPPYNDDPEKSRPYFAKLKDTLEFINSKLGINMKHLSMGMSNDFEIAVQEGATHVRIGTLLYGERSYIR